LIVFIVLASGFQSFDVASRAKRDAIPRPGAALKEELETMPEINTRPAPPC
jgi:hypothetical protein